MLYQAGHFGASGILKVPRQVGEGLSYSCYGDWKVGWRWQWGWWRWWFRWAVVLLIVVTGLEEFSEAGKNGAKYP